MTKRYPQQDLANRLRSALAESGLSQADLARACDVTEQSVHGWVTNGRISKQHLPTIAALTGKGLEFFLVGLKTWRRAAAIALPFLLVPQALTLFEALRGCVLCQIITDRVVSAFAHRSRWNRTSGQQIGVNPRYA